MRVFNWAFGNLVQRNKKSRRSQKHQRRIQIEMLEERYMLAAGIQDVQLVDDTHTLGDLITEDPRIAAEMSGTWNDYAELEIDQDGDGAPDWTTMISFSGEIIEFDPRDFDPLLSNTNAPVTLSLRTVEYDSSFTVTSTSAWQSFDFTVEHIADFQIENVDLVDDTHVPGDLITQDPRIAGTVVGAWENYVDLEIDQDGDGSADWTTMITSSVESFEYDPTDFDPSLSTASAAVTLNYRAVELDASFNEVVATSWQTFALTVNHGPDTVDDSVSTDYNTPVTIDVLANDSSMFPLDVTSVNATFGPISGPPPGSLQVNSADGSILYTPDNSVSNWSVPIIYTVAYNLSTTSIWTAVNVFVGATASNTQPTLTNPGNQNSSEGDLIGIQLMATDTEDTVGDLTFSATGLPNGLVITNAGLIGGTIDYTAAESAPTNNGQYVVTVTVTDTGGMSQQRMFNWTVSNGGIDFITATEFDPPDNSDGQYHRLEKNSIVVNGISSQVLYIAPNNLVNFT